MQPAESDPPAPALHQAERTAHTSMAEACGTPRPSEANTGELIRIEEFLATASDAVKRAISLRRRRADEVAREAVRASLADVEAEASADGTHRIFRDSRGVRWDVFAVYPESRLSVRWHLDPPYAAGWLCFDSSGQKRRLSPVPPTWDRLTNADLEQLVERADVVRRPSAPSPDGRPDDRTTS